MENLFVCQNLSRKNRRTIWMELAARPSRMKKDDEKSVDPMRFALGFVDAPIMRPTPVPSVARMFCFGIL